MNSFGFTPLPSVAVTVMLRVVVDDLMPIQIALARGTHGQHAG
jgi:hypothetical protein